MHSTIVLPHRSALCLQHARVAHTLDHTQLQLQRPTSAGVGPSHSSSRVGRVVGNSKMHRFCWAAGLVGDYASPSVSLIKQGRNPANYELRTAKKCRKVKSHAACVTGANFVKNGRAF